MAGQFTSLVMQARRGLQSPLQAGPTWRDAQLRAQVEAVERNIDTIAGRESLILHVLAMLVSARDTEIPACSLDAFLRLMYDLLNYLSGTEHNFYDHRTPWWGSETMWRLHQAVVMSPVSRPRWLADHLEATILYVSSRHIFQNEVLVELHRHRRELTRLEAAPTDLNNREWKLPNGMPPMSPEWLAIFDPLPGW